MRRCTYFEPPGAHRVMVVPIRSPARSWTRQGSALASTSPALPNQLLNRCSILLTSDLLVPRGPNSDATRELAPMWWVSGSDATSSTLRRLPHSPGGHDGRMLVRQGSESIDVFSRRTSSEAGTFHAREHPRTTGIGRHCSSQLWSWGVRKPSVLSAQCHRTRRQRKSESYSAVPFCVHSMHESRCQPAAAAAQRRHARR